MDDYGVTRPLGDASRFRRSVRVDVCGHVDCGVPEDLCVNFRFPVCLNRRRLGCYFSSILPFLPGISRLGDEVSSLVAETPRART